MLTGRVRRQNVSCDQCRRSKKACDGYYVNRKAYSPIVLPCSYCVKTKKQCGLHEHWAAPSSSESASASASMPFFHEEPTPLMTGADLPPPPPFPHGAAAPRIGADIRASLAPSDPSDVASGAHVNLHVPGSVPVSVSVPDAAFYGWGTPLPTTLPPPPMVAGPQADFNGVFDDEFVPLSTERHASADTLPYTGSFGSGPLELLGFPPPQSSSQLEPAIPATAGYHQDLSPSSTMRPSATPRASSSSSVFHHPDRRQQEDKDRWRRLTATSTGGHPSSSQGLMAACNSRLVTDSLLRIYHDVLENNLACWLAEHTCPYKPKTQSPYSQYQHPIYQQHQQHQQLYLTHEYTSGACTFNSEDPPQREWGSVWSNQMYRRVKDLDRAARANGLIHTTRAEDQAASKALNLAIMAFATQWAQGGRRRDRFPVYPDVAGPQEDENDNDDDDDLEGRGIRDEFEEHFQLQLWESAKRALDDLEAVDSFKVVYAELIFGLIQRPWLASRAASGGFPSFDHDGSSIRDAIFRQIRDIINEDGPPVYLDRASRKIRALRIRCEAATNNHNNPSNIRRSVSSSPPNQLLTDKQKVTVALLYWLAVMFDTVSSSINQRPVVVADEECQHESAVETPSPEAASFTTYASPPSSSASPSASSHHWDLSLFSKDNPDRPSTLRWPCAYDDAAESVTRSAAVKVLLFRYISYLQNAMRAASSLREAAQGDNNRRAVEDIILSITRVHRYWNMTHGSFFRDLIRDYDTVPARIKSWFPCIHIPWLLGSLLVADLIDMVDENGLGTDEGSTSRATTNLTARIRKASATELADLARVTTPQDDSKTGTSDKQQEDQLPSYHFAVNEGTLLTEPWTVLLIRAFAKACIYHLSVAEDLRSCEWEMLGRGESDEYRRSLDSADACIRALWFLGRKSEMARQLSLVFAGAVKRLQVRDVKGDVRDTVKMGREFWVGSPV